MGKKPTKPSKKATVTKTPKDSQVYAGIRWSVNALENLALEAYWEDTKNWPEIQKCLDVAYKCLYPLGSPRGGDDCPWPSCGQGTRCKPICE